MAVYVKPNGSHKEAIDFKVKVGGAWKDGVEVLTKVDGRWKSVWKGETVFVFERGGGSATHIVSVSGISSTSDKVTLENVRFVVMDEGWDRVTTYEKFVQSYNGQSIEYKTSSNAVGARVTITAKPTNTVEIFIDILRNSVDRVEFAFSKIYKS